jgi:hypothetical protein
MQSTKIPIGSKCTICGEEDPRVLMERHHLFGRNNDNKIITIICISCHRKITIDQNMMPPSARKKGASEEDKRNFMIVSMGSYIEIVGKQLKKIGMKKYKDQV